VVPKIVLDTNIIVSAFGWKGSPHQILLRCLEGEFQLYLSSALLREISRVLSYPKFGFNQPQIDEFIALIVENAAMVEPDFTLDIVSEDPSDNRILECAAAGGCRYIVTGDMHLLKIGALQDIQIIPLDTFFALYPSDPS